MSATVPVSPLPEFPPVKPLSRVRRPRALGGGASLAAQGEPMIWLTGGALAIAILMILSLLTLIVYQGGATFWPTPVVLLEVKRGADSTALFLGEITRVETVQFDASDVATMPDAERAQAESMLVDGELEIRRQLLRSGNFELTGDHFRWLDDHWIVSATRPDWAMVVERVELGRFYGLPRSITIDGQIAADAQGKTGEARLAVEARIWELFQQHHGAVVARRNKIIHKEKHELGGLSYTEEQARLKMRAAELRWGGESTRYQQAAASFAEISQRTQAEFARIREEIEQLRAENDKFQIAFDAASGASELVEHSLPLASIVRMYPANHLSTAQKLGVYFSRWWEFLFDDPREANSEGGVWPAIVGTVTLTMIMAIAVVPFGVLAALYLREYAKPGLVVSAVRIAINNLAGVPSIVFGVFGLHFFCYIVGAGVDDIFFPANVADGNPVYGKGALVWASLTLALLTLPVVIVAAEEALSAVPNSMREGSYACGAGKWQTLRRIVLPRAMPGIMTGMILAMARGAGEVAPLMLVGAVKLAPELTIDGTFPFLHPERSFMHLGFHIYDVGLQSPNSEAAKPMVYTTTLLLLVLIAVLNMAAIWLRQRLALRFHTTHI